jgi:hypothetical protein
MYMPAFQPPSTYLQYVNDVQVNHVRNGTTSTTNTLNYADAGATAGFANAAVPGLPQSIVGLAVNGNLTLYGAGTAARAEFISGVFTGHSVFVTSGEIISPALSSFGLANLIGNLRELHAMDCETTPTFIVEIEVLGVSNHMKFNGQQGPSRVTITKRIPLNAASYGGFMRQNADGQEQIDYGTCLGLSKVSSIKCRVLNEYGQVLNLAQPDSFPPWTFSLAFEC